MLHLRMILRVFCPTLYYFIRLVTIISMNTIIGTTIKYQNTLKEHRLRLGLTQEQVAKHLNIPNSKDRISMWEKGIALPSIPNLFKLCKLYKTNPLVLYPGMD